MTAPRARSRLAITVCCVLGLFTLQVGLAVLLQYIGGPIPDEFAFWLAPTFTPGFLLLIVGSWFLSGWVPTRLGLPPREAATGRDYLAGLICLGPSLFLFFRTFDLAGISPSVRMLIRVLVLACVVLQTVAATYLRPMRARLWMWLCASPALVLAAMRLYLIGLQALFGERITEGDILELAARLAIALLALAATYAGVRLGRRMALKRSLA